MESKSLEHAPVEIQASNAQAAEFRAKHSTARPLERCAMDDHFLLSSLEAAILRGCTVEDIRRFVMEDRTLPAWRVDSRGISYPFKLGAMRGQHEPDVGDLCELTDPYTGKSVGHLRFKRGEVVRHLAEWSHGQAACLPWLGRPKKDRPAPVNTSAASLDRIEKYTLAILKILTLPSPFFKYFERFDPPQAARIAEELAYELAFFPAMNGLVCSTDTGRSGPKPKTAQGLFFAQVRQVLNAHGVTIPIWKNARKTCTELVDFCQLIARVTDTRTVGISFRTVEQAPKAGFSDKFVVTTKRVET